MFTPPEAAEPEDGASIPARRDGDAPSKSILKKPTERDGFDRGQGRVRTPTQESGLEMGPVPGAATPVGATPVDGVDAGDNAEPGVNGPNEGSDEGCGVRSCCLECWKTLKKATNCVVEGLSAAFHKGICGP